MTFTLKWTDTGSEGDLSTAPALGREGDAGLDLTTSRPCTIGPRQNVDVPCGIAVEFPEHVWGLILGRSSTLRKRRLMVNPGVIDTGYRGELFVNVHNLEDQEVNVQAGERLGQLILLPNLASSTMVEYCKELSQSERGTQGFGSTGL